jgi:CheY-like chemotaxis protein
VAKILVADDNSNIQRMVGLALKDQGIEVVAVGNGEAAVRKISELRPDLVLADVFMPVRNGYEVCQYVKEDATLAHIPVILLVGAFDPLDEQEAQRVGADGVLKKPFVPPDPLIAMVKAALERAGISLSPAKADKSAAPAAPSRKGADLLPKTQPLAPPVSPLAGVAFSSPPPPPAPISSSPAVSQPVAPFVGDENFVDEPAQPEPVRIDAAKHTMAFGNLLGPTTTTEDPGFAADEVETGRAADWRSLDEPDDVPEEEEEVEAKEAAPSWRRDGAETVFDDGSGPVKDWRDSAVVQTAGRQSARETWEQAEDKGGFVTAADVPTEMGAFASEMTALEAESEVARTQVVETEETPLAEVAGSEPVQSDFSNEPIATASDTTSSGDRGESSAPQLRAMELPGRSAPDEHSTATPPHVNGEFTGEIPAAAGSPEISNTAVVEETRLQPEHSHAAKADNVSPVEKIPEVAQAESWFSRPASPWDTDAQKTNPLAGSWDAGNITPAARNSSSSEPQTAEIADAPGNNGQSSSEEVATVISDEPVAEVIAEPATSTVPAGADMDALVAKVLAKLSPEVLQAVTREILKPMVAALVEDELKSKK